MNLSRVDRLRLEARALGLRRASGIYSHFWHRKCVEPVKRKHGSSQPEWQSHRFEIKGGISWREAWLRDARSEASRPNPLQAMIRTPDTKWFTFKETA